MQGRKLLRALCSMLLVLAWLPGATTWAQENEPAQATEDVFSDHFVVTVDGVPVPVMHAALNLYFLNVTAAKSHRIVVTAPTADFWAKGVEVQPWRLNVRPQIAGRTISFDLRGEAKVVISRPGEYLANAEMLYLFANSPEIDAPSGVTSSVRYYGPGIRHENIDAHSGDTIYLAPGAVIFGSLNLWQVSHVRVFGRGVLIYDGPQNPADDDGWMHKPNWHCIVMDHAQEISIEGLTCVVRSRTWQIQMTESRHILFDNVKVIGANAGNANADGMDWLGGGDTIVRNSFFRAADDVFAMQSGWDGYTDAALADDGHPVTNIVVENSTVSTSVSNIVRAAWPRKNFEGGQFTMRNVDVLHAGLGGCGVPFALMEMWADPAGRGESAGFHFSDIRLEDWYTLFQLRQPSPGIRDVSFTDVMAPEQPALVQSVVRGQVRDVHLDNVIVAGALIARTADLPAVAEAAAPEPMVTNTAPIVQMRAVAGLVRPGQKVRFEAIGADAKRHGMQYTWLFGDGLEAHGRKVSHRFADSEGTLRDGSSRFRILLHVTTSEGRNLWLYQPVVVAGALRPPHPFVPGITFTYREDTASGPEVPVTTGRAALFSLAAVPHRAEQYTLSLEGDINVPTDGTYTFLAIANGATRLLVDGVLRAESPEPFAQVCGLSGSAARPIALSAALAKGAHRVKLTEVHGEGEDNLRLLWQGPGFALQPLPAAP